MTQFEFVLCLGRAGFCLMKEAVENRCYYLAWLTFLAFYWSAGFRRFLQVSALASHWLEDCANFTPTPSENDKYSANHS
jgi:hypothetical protein